MPDLTDPTTRMRVVQVNRLQPTKFCSNKISTSKYNLFTFFPRFLMEQFRRYANIFFLVIAVLQQIPDVSPTGRYTTAFPLLIILSVSAIKELFEDLKRQQADRKVNQAEVKVLRSGSWVSHKWQEVCVGDILKVENNENFPADILLLSSSEPQAMAYIETSNLDGETNLKIRQGHPSTATLLSHDDLYNLVATVQSEMPNRHIYEFTANLTVQGQQTVPLGPDSMLLRGSRLKNTRWVFGVVLYTGAETKLVMNSRKAPLKRSNVDVVTNYQILALFLVLMVVSLASAVGAQVWDDKWMHLAFYLGRGQDMNNFGKNLLTFFILYNNLIPISLQVSLEGVRFFQAYFINSDLDMYYEPTDTPAMARTSNLNEELGQVKYLFTDKTGTLTQNVMTFKKCSVAGIIYGSDVSPKFDDRTLLDNWNGRHVTAQVIREFLTLMAICHTVVPEHSDGGDIIYQASSPDEGSLVRGAKDQGFIFHTRTPESVIISVHGTDEKYEILNVLEFTSSRKRMSVVVRCPDGRIKLYIKGADNVIFDRLADNQLYTDITIKHLEEFATSGYRTLCFAKAEISEDYYNQWRRGFYEASIAINDREEKIAVEAEKIESGLTLLGASAIEDKLQDGVPETIAALLKADIKIWVLTGDKRETAINIGHSCRLISPNMPVMIVQQRSSEEVHESIRGYINDLGPQHLGRENDVALVVDGESMRYALMPSVSEDFLSLATSCRVVICCRASPMQKSEIVELVKSNVGAITLAIGDGANDVAMIQAAHVGVGISGQEGLQAASASDYAIAQFRFLIKLLFVHGAWSFHRTVKLILYSFYKNICLYIIELWFAMFSAWSGQPLFERWTIGLYNVIFTAAPPLVIGLFDRTASAETMLKYPLLYKLSQDKKAFSIRIFWIWILESIFHSVLIFFLSVGAMDRGVLWSNGRTGGWLMLGNSVYTYVVVVVCLKAAIELDAWTWVTHLGIWGSIASWFVFLPVYGFAWPLSVWLGTSLAPEMAGMAGIVFSSAYFWLALFVVPSATLFIDVIYKIVRRTAFKTIADEVRELELMRADPSVIFPKLTRRRPKEDAPVARESRTPQELKKQTESRGRVGLSETARLLRSAFRRSASGTTLTEEAQRGYAFSQEEHGVVGQGQLIRVYDSTRAKPEGL